MSYKMNVSGDAKVLGTQQPTEWQLAWERLSELEKRLQRINDGDCTVRDEQEETTISGLVNKYKEMKFFSEKKEELLTGKKSRVRGISGPCNEMRKRILGGLCLKSGEEERRRLLMAIGNVEPKEKVIEALEGLLACYKKELMNDVSGDKFMK